MTPDRLDSATPQDAMPARSASPPPPTSRRRHGWRWLLIGAVVLLVLLGASVTALLGAAHSERGTRWLWRAACELSGGRLSGTLRDGTLATGLQMDQVRWHDAGDTVSVDHLDGAWALTRAPWRLSLDYLHLDTVDLVLEPSHSPSAPLSLPQQLRLPLQLVLRSVRIDRLRWRQGGGAVTEITQIALHGTSDGVHHALTLDSLSTPLGSLSGSVALTGQRPYPVNGGIAFAGRVAARPVEISARASGTLSTLRLDVDAASSGLQALSGHAQVVATPFAKVPLQSASLNVDHLDLRAFDIGAPSTDIRARVDLQPQAAAASAGLTVAGAVTIQNASAGPLDLQRLPLAGAQASVTLDAQHQRLDKLALQFYGGGTASGAGQVDVSSAGSSSASSAGSSSASSSASSSGTAQGQFTLSLADFDWSVLSNRLKPARLGGSLSLSLGRTSSASWDLADPKAGLRLRGTLHTDAAQLTLDSAHFEAGHGEVELSGSLKRNANADYVMQTRFNAFDPFLVLQGQGAHPVSRVRADRRPEQAEHATTPVATPHPSPALARQFAPYSARISGTLALQGALAQDSAQAELMLRDSVYDDLPLTGGGTIRLRGRQILPSQLALAIAGNQIDLHGAFGAPGDHLAFHLDAPHLDRLGLGLAGTMQADGRLGGSFSRPEVSATYDGADLAYGAYRLGHAQGRVDFRDGSDGVLALNLQAANLNVPGASLQTLSADLNGTRSHHALTLHAQGAVQGQAVDLTLAAHGALTHSAAGTGWDGVITQLENRALPALQLLDPLTVSIAPGMVELHGAQGNAHLSLEGAALEVRRLQYLHGSVSAAGSARGIDVDRLLRLSRSLGATNPAFKTDLILDGDWDFTLAEHASGYLQLARRSGDVTLNTWRGAAAMGFSALSARLDFSAANQAKLSVRATAARIGHLTADLQANLSPRDGFLSLNDASALSGAISGDLPSLRTTGGLFGPGYVLDGSLQLQLQLAGVLAHPRWSGAVSGDGLSATLIDQGIQFKQGQLRIALTDNLVQIHQLMFHGASGTLSASGQIKLDEANPNLGVNVQADKLELFATPDRQLQLSGQATVRNTGDLAGAGDISIDGHFKVDHALFDLPDSAAPQLGPDVHIVELDGTEVNASKPSLAQTAQTATTPPTPPKNGGSLTPRTHIAIDLGDAFRFRGAGADLGLRGQLVATSAPDQPLRAVGNVSVTPGSTYTTFGRKLNIDSGFFTFNGPIDNPGINITAMRQNQEVVAGVQVSGTVQAPVAKLVSEPNVPDNEKLSWLLFGHGTDTGTNFSQQSAMTEAFALLGNAGGKRVAQTLGLDEVSIGQSEVGLTDPQVVSLSKALNQRIVLGYEQGLTTAASVLKVTLTLSRFWSIALHTGAVNGATLLYNRRFD